jgi:hypothetical protein
MRHSRLQSLAVLVILGALGAHAQGLYWEATTTFSGLGAQERHSKVYYMPKMYKETSDLGNEISMIRIDKELFITVNTKDKTYTEMTFAEMEGMMKQAGRALNDKMAAMQEKLKSMPEEQRKMVEKMMGGAMAKGGDQPVEVRKGTEKETISGFSCTKNIIVSNGKELCTIWTTTDVAGLDRMAGELKDFLRRIAATIPMNGKLLAEGYKGIEGFPVQTEMAMFTRTVTKVEKRSTPAAEFEVPAGYKKVKSKIMELKEGSKDDD